MRTNEEMLDEIMNANDGEGPDPLRSYDGEPLRALAQAVEARTGADAAVMAAVYRAREAGASWQMIGTILGITKQGASKRYGTAA